MENSSSQTDFNSANSSEAAISTVPVPWKWWRTEDAEAIGADLPVAGPERHLFEVAESFREAANSGVSVMLVYGWAKGAVDAICADAHLRTKEIHWLLPADQLHHLKSALAAPGAEIKVTACACANLDEAMTRAQSLGIFWTLAVLEDGPAFAETASRMHLARWFGLLRTRHRLHRIFGDLGHVIRRQDDLGQAIPLGAFHNRHAGKAALCVAAGPSLDRHIAFVRQAQDRCIVIAADIVAARLEDAGVRVDFVVNVDTSPILLERCTPMRNRAAVLVAPLECIYGLENRFGAVCYFPTTFAFAHLKFPVAFFARGTNVGGATLGFAHWLGCTEAVLVGHDLSFGGPETYYSKIVASPDELSDFNLRQAANQGGFITVPGNGPDEVTTDSNFKMAIEDLEQLIKRLDPLVVYNPNINVGLGARIQGALALPEGWQPTKPIEDRALPRERIADTRVPPAEPLDAALLKSWRAWCEAWRAGDVADEDPYTLLCRLEDGEDMRLGASVAYFSFAGHLSQIGRLISQAGHLPRRAALRQHRRVITGCLEALTPVLEALVGTGQLPVVELPSTDAFTPEMFSAFLARQPILPNGSYAAGTIREGMLEMVNLHALIPQVPLPSPLSAHDAVTRLIGFGQRLSLAQIVESLAVCHLDPGPGAAALAAAIELKLIPADLFSSGPVDPPPPWNAMPAAMAVRALERLRAGRGRAGDPELAAAFPPCQVLLVEALLHDGPDRAGRIGVLQALVASDTIPIDDAIAARIIELHPNVMAACDLLAPYEKHLSEASTLAIARRHLVIGEHQAALGHAARIRPLSELAEEATTLVFACRFAVGGLDAVAEALPGVLLTEVRSGALVRFLETAFGPEKAWGIIDQLQLAPLPPRHLARVLTQVLRQDDQDAMRTGLATVARILARTKAEPHPPKWDADLNELTLALERLPGGAARAAAPVAGQGVDGAASVAG